MAPQLPVGFFWFFCYTVKLFQASLNNNCAGNDTPNIVTDKPPQLSVLISNISQLKSQGKGSDHERKPQLPKLALYCKCRITHNEFKTVCYFLLPNHSVFFPPLMKDKPIPIICPLYFTDPTHSPPFILSLVLIIIRCQKQGV